MRVVYFSQDYTPHDHRFLEALAGTEHEVHFLRLEDGRRALEERPIPDGVQMVDWWGGARRLGWTDVPAAVSQVGRVLRRLAPDIVHAGPVQKTAFLTALAGYRPLVTMSWGWDLLWEAQAGVGKWSARYALAKTDVLVCDCDVVRRRAIDLGMPQDRIVMFPWGVDLEHFSPGPEDELRRELGWEEAFVALTTRALEPVYGVDIVVEAFIRAAPGCDSLRLLVLGTGSMEVDLRGRIESAGLQDRVHFPGQVGFDQLPRYFRAADVYVSASHSDGSSISLLEAMACGLPALVSDIPGNREWVEPEVNGRWFPDGDVDALARSLLQACRRPDEFARLGERGREIAEQRANWPVNFAKLMAAYELAHGLAGEGA